MKGWQARLVGGATAPPLVVVGGTGDTLGPDLSEHFERNLWPPRNPLQMDSWKPEVYAMKNIVCVYMKTSRVSAHGFADMDATRALSLGCTLWPWGPSLLTAQC